MWLYNNMSFNLLKYDSIDLTVLIFISVEGELISNNIYIYNISTSIIMNY